MKSANGAPDPAASLELEKIDPKMNCPPPLMLSNR